MNAAGQWAFVINVDFWDVPFMRWCFKTRGVYDMVMGSKRADHSLNHQPNYRRFLSWGLNSILQTVFGFVGSDTHGINLFICRLCSLFFSNASCVADNLTLNSPCGLRDNRCGLRRCRCRLSSSARRAT